MVDSNKDENISILYRKDLYTDDSELEYERIDGSS